MSWYAATSIPQYALPRSVRLCLSDGGLQANEKGALGGAKGRTRGREVQQRFPQPFGQASSWRTPTHRPYETARRQDTEGKSVSTPKYRIRYLRVTLDKSIVSGEAQIEEEPPDYIPANVIAIQG
ncbi:hypothetical protein TEQG_01245 [Trichophyton equinum CBS 127.97]|uniref:Uncharacterized protein n=1 Tax=Trichophyton equinum (strain ATCC MYA-4606 / CBS 127.97) TaxID=559882 RepID=F2PJY7_TRIEC|nr:hypothetical protein TEQG_01245 [Trichophyton equinum CBS 127.97]